MALLISSYIEKAVFVCWMHKDKGWKRNQARESPGGPVVKTLLSLLRVQIQSLVGELISHEPCGSASQSTEKTETKEEMKEG